jgi:F-type H+-transporting ATPase subunit b
MLLEINYTFLIQIAIFLLLLLLMNIILYRPIRRILIKRDEKTKSLQEMIGDYQDRSEKNDRDLEENMIQARKDGFVEKERLKSHGEDEGKKVLVETNSLAEAKIGKAKDEVEVKMAGVRKDLEGQISGLSRDLAEKILSRSIQ